MSLHTCINRLDKEIQKIERVEQSLSWLFTEKYLKKLKEEKELAQQLRTSLIERETLDNFNKTKTDNEFKLINDYEEKYKELPSYLTFIRQDLRQMRDMMHPTLQMRMYGMPVNHETYLKNYREYHCASVQQQLDFRAGLDDGNCFGYTYAMVDPNLTPYGEKKITRIPLNRQIHNYQNNQFNEEHNITRQRLTRRIFCPDLQQQAEQLWATAAQNKGSDLMVTLQSRNMAHATYLSVREDNSIRYMDPNIGAYLFNNKQEFINFYQDAYKISHNFKFYQVNKIQYNPDGNLTEEKTFSGLMRTILTGEKRAYSINAAILSFSLALSIYVGLSATPLLLFAVAPAFAESISAFITTAVILSTIGGTWSGYKGILGGSHFVQEVFHDTIGSRLNPGFFNTKKEPADENEQPSPPKQGLN
ncbi:MAG: hypothetical protein LEGION0403_FIIPPAGN_01841 [Legionella sp.]|uniref:hypothetical protein n=1 Tax=Legionella sp. TaxID=459 RepID=UPI003D0C9ACF